MSDALRDRLHEEMSSHHRPPSPPVDEGEDETMTLEVRLSPAEWERYG